MTSWRGWDNLTTETGGASNDYTATAVGDTMEIVRNHDTGDPLTLGKEWTSRNCSITNTDFPMDLTTGHTEIDLFDTADDTGDSRCGFSFSRPKLRQENMPFFSAWDTPSLDIPSADSYEVVGDRLAYGDYRVDWNVPSDGGTIELILQHAVWDEEAGKTHMKEIEYTLAPSVAGGDDGATNPVKNRITKDSLTDKVGSAGENNHGFVGKFRVLFRGSGIQLWMRFWTDEGAGKPGSYSWKLVCDSTALSDTDNRTDPRYCWAPINQCKEALYMGCSM